MYSITETTEIKNMHTQPSTYPLVYRDECDCDRRCQKCGKLKNPVKFGPEWTCTTTPTITVWTSSGTISNSMKVR